MASIQEIIINQVTEFITKKNFSLNDFTIIDQDWKIVITHNLSQKHVRIHYKKFKVKDIIDITEPFKKYIKKQLRKLIDLSTSSTSSTSSSTSSLSSERANIEHNKKPEVTNRRKMDCYK